MKPAISPKPREANGRHKRDRTKEALEAADRAQRLKNMATVLSQPHRLGDTDQRLESALGRFCKHHRLRDECWRAGEEYWLDVRRWQMVVASIKAEGHKASGNVQGETTREEADKLTKKVLRADEELKYYNSYPYVRHICVDFRTQDIRELPASFTPAIIRGLFALGVHYGMLPIDSEIPYW